MPGVRIRIAREVDATAMAAVVASAFEPFSRRTGIVPEPLRTDWATVVSAQGARVATRDGIVVGVLVLWPHPDHVLVETLAVSPDAQGAGVGTLLLDLAEREAIEAGVNAVRLDTNAAMTANLGYYPRRGYVETGRHETRGFSRVRFEKRLLPG